MNESDRVGYMRWLGKGEGGEKGWDGWMQERGRERQAISEKANGRVSYKEL